MRSRRLLIALCMPLAMAACSIGKPLPQTSLYVIDSPRGIAVSSGSPLQETLRVGNVRVSAPFAGSALVYRLSDVRYAPDPYNAFGADPGAMLGGEIARWLDEASGFRAVTHPGSTTAAPFVLEVNVIELYGDFRADKPPSAVLSMQFSLIDQATVRHTLAYERFISTSIRLPEASPDALVRGFGAALAEILTQVSTELGDQLEP